MKTILIQIIKFYQIALSSLLIPSCRFTPTCSSYAILAISKYGTLRGAWLSVKRLLKCHPFHEGGIDNLD